MAKGRALPWVLVAVLAIALAVALISRGSVNSKLSSANERLSAAQVQLAVEKEANDDLTGDVSQWKSDAQHWQRSTSYYQAQVRGLRKRITDSLGNIEHPTFSLWNTCGSGGPKAACALKPGWEFIGGLPDTFTYRLKFRSTVPVTVWVLSAGDFVCFESRNCTWHGQTWEDRRSMDLTLHQAEGCAGYFAVFRSEQEGTLYPDVWVTRNPAPELTGACA